MNKNVQGLILFACWLLRRHHIVERKRIEVSEGKKK